MKPTVLVLQEWVPPYRVPFFRSLSDELDSRGLDLRVVSSSDLSGLDEPGFRHERVLMSKGGLSSIETIYRIRPEALVLPHDARFALLATAARLLQGRMRKQLLWGMGIARRYSVSSPYHSRPAAMVRSYGAAWARYSRPAAKAVRRLMLSTCDQYLSYTDISTENILSEGYDAARITTLNNAVEALAIPEEVKAAQRIPLQMLFVASLVEDKEPLAAIAIVDRLRRLIPSATLHIVGDGPLRSQCEHAASEREWVRCHGSQRGRSLRELALASDIAIIPGRVGLAVLEMASAGLPMATFAVSLHGAEIAYLKDGINGLLLNGGVDAAAKDLGTLLADRPALERMRVEALSTASTYTLRNMAVNFANGVITA